MAWNLTRAKKILHKRLFDFLNSYRSIAHTPAIQTPSEMFIGRNIRTIIDLIQPQLMSEMPS